MRVCIVYDCLFPNTVGGAERWYRDLAQELARTGHEVTYLTRRQWSDDDPPRIPGVGVVAVSPGGPLYTGDGRRRTGPPLRFGWGVLVHLLRNRRRYDALHLCAFPFFSLIAARAALAGTRVKIAVDWFEVWTAGYWRAYLGGVGGLVGRVVQRLCVALTPQAFVFSRLHAKRLADQGVRGEPIVLSGLYGGALEPADPGGERAPLAVFAGRQIREKRAHLLAPAVAAARERVPGLRGLVLGDGPEHQRVLASVREARAEAFVEVPGFVATEEVERALAGATCMVLPSVREGYGLVVIEAAAKGTPSVAVAAADNAAPELIDEGVNGFVARDEGAGALADAIVAVHQAGPALRSSTSEWFSRRGSQLTAAASARQVASWYARSASVRRDTTPQPGGG